MTSLLIIIIFTLLIHFVNVMILKRLQHKDFNEESACEYQFEDAVQHVLYLCLTVIHLTFQYLSFSVVPLQNFAGIVIRKFSGCFDVFLYVFKPNLPLLCVFMG
jgi:hypothetical protein